MKGLIATVYLIFSFSTLSYSQGYIFGVKTPIEQRLVNGQIKGGQVEKGFTSFCLSAKPGTAMSYSGRGSGNPGSWH